jgi:hypothetical protein
VRPSRHLREVRRDRHSSGGVLQRPFVHVATRESKSKGERGRGRGGVDVREGKGGYEREGEGSQCQQVMNESNSSQEPRLPQPIHSSY